MDKVQSLQTHTFNDFWMPSKGPFGSEIFFCLSSDLYLKRLHVLAEVNPRHEWPLLANTGFYGSELFKNKAQGKQLPPLNHRNAPGKKAQCSLQKPPHTWQRLQSNITTSVQSLSNAAIVSATLEIDKKRFYEHCQNLLPLITTIIAAVLYAAVSLQPSLSRQFQETQDKWSQSFCAISPNLSLYTLTFPILHHPSPPSHSFFLPLELGRVSVYHGWPGCIRVLAAAALCKQASTLLPQRRTELHMPFPEQGALYLNIFQRFPHLNQFQLHLANI